MQLLSKTGLERLDSRRDMITQSMFKEIKTQNTPLHYLLPPVKVSHSQMVLRPTYPSISTSTLKNYPLWKGFCTILHFQEILLLINYVCLCFTLEYQIVVLICYAFHVVLFVVVVHCFHCMISTIWLHLK